MKGRSHEAKIIFRVLKFKTSKLLHTANYYDLDAPLFVSEESLNFPYI